MSRGHLLLIEDDENLGSTLTDNLLMDGFEVEWCRDGRLGLEAFFKTQFDLVILDMMLPFMNGLDVLKNLKDTTSVPVLMISANGTPNDRIRGLRLKADDYLSKPFHLEEFLLRVGALVRRRTVDQPLPQQIEIGKSTVDFLKMSGVDCTGHGFQLTDKECRVLRLLVTRAGQVVDRKQILDLVWGTQTFPTTRTIDNMIVQFRKWFEPNPSEPKYVISYRGVGYSLRISGTENSQESPQ